MSTRLDKTQVIVQHILRHLTLPRRFPPGVEHSTTKPLFVGLSGPQGIGKTTMTNKLVSVLSGTPHNLRVFSFSTDDLYLPYKDQTALSQRYPDNKLIEFRGLPGTHDVHLGASTFQAFCDANRQFYAAAPATTQHQQQLKQGTLTSNVISVPIPAYDKALHSGRGDQLPREQWSHAEAPFDVILFEGWSLGFKSIRDPLRLQQIYQEHNSNSSSSQPCSSFLSKHPYPSIEMVNEFLKAYEREWYSYLDVFIHLSAPKLETIFKWRAEQEQELWARRGTGMTEEQVRDFVTRFMPAYEVYLERLKRENLFKKDDDDEHSEHKGRVEASESESGLYVGRHLRLDLDEDRNLVSTALVD
ncbi:hypothetical protein BX616_006711 [Lobosporangium transversale]|uniref:p-loop containing nucleoside triphosphate hydrolase protein n=1 Tax=Lobosporangium transversale TaxID=64571 RepID=A0A1Y2GDU2_9FUNG|nr:P-loop containing nucleoside triphosphate hydrolase protein [Lobosporangium transversale]KAF9896813.1 hypothetical protein BX616_006711 [Lobosporangium transversale]ORZ04989.1 P-loop containing nucleoside triphosphate hydrolase protein [Lobosporangium transversale]|eukprot:XP_021876853.1 P-loop containing nucleoside triphosphate hydrolase protein [Lobosporangium transversale]